METKDNELNLYHHNEVVNRRYELNNDSQNNNHFLNQIVFAFTGTHDALTEELKSFPVTTLVEYLHNSHKYYLEKKLPEMENLIYELSKNSNNKLSAVLEVFFLKFSKDLHTHINYEEKYLFPYIKELILGQATISYNSFSASKFIESHSHETEDQLKLINEHLSTTFSELNHLFEFNHFKNHMNSFEIDLRIHGVIEDHILIPQIVELEKELLGE